MTPQDDSSHSSSNGEIRGGIESFSYDDGIVRKFAAATLLWGLAATGLGLVVGLLLVAPTMLGYAPDYTFARLNPIYTNIVLYGFVGNGLFAAVYFSTQRLCKTRMWSGLLSQLHFWSWQAMMVVGVVSLSMGISQGKAFSELEWSVDIAISIVWILIFGANFLMTLYVRRERYLYISLWFYVAAYVGVSILFVLNYLHVPIDGWNSYPMVAGVDDALLHGWYSHNLIAFMLIVPFLGLMYYFIPKSAGRSVYSYRLAIVQFWSLVVLLPWAGPSQLHFTPLAEWVSTLGMLFGIMLWMPLWGGLINGWMTIRSAWTKLSDEPVLKFFLVGIGFYGLATLQGPIMSIKSVSGLTQYTDLNTAHFHSLAFGWSGMLIFGMIYWLMPRIFKAEVFSQRAVNTHFWIATIGLLLFIVPTYLAGFSQAWMWSALDDKGNLIYTEHADTFDFVTKMWWIRVVGGAIYAVGVLVAMGAFAATWARRTNTNLEESVQACRDSSALADEKSPRPSKLANAPVLQTACKLEVGRDLAWHRRWERLPSRFATLTVVAVGVAALFEVVPSILLGGSLPPTSKTKPYTPLELAGREIYLSEGCNACHSQTVRPTMADYQRYGDFSTADEYAYDQPSQWGRRRIGPDLAREGGRQSSFWHWDHLGDPRKEEKGSMMPAYVHLLDTPLDFEEITTLVERAKEMGVPYDKELTMAPALARIQAERIGAEIVAGGGPVYRGETLVMETQVVALIAYLQRLGTDRYVTASSADSTVEETPVEQTTE